MSFRGKLFHILLRNRHLFTGKLQGEIIDTDTSIEMLRYKSDRMAKKMMRKQKNIKIIPAKFNDFYAEWVIPENAPQNKAVLYFHGGGFVMGNAQSHRNIVGNFVKHLGIKALVFNYRLAPENPAPAAVEDSFTIYRWLLSQEMSSENIVFAGDSAGGGIGLSTLLKCRDENVPLPAACAFFSPCTDLTLSGDSHQSRAQYDPCTPEGANKTFCGYYAGTGDPKHPYASPLFGDWHGMPPVIIQVGNDETLRDDSVSLAEKIRLSDGEVQIKVWKGMFHCFPLMAPMFPEATEALQETCQFLRIKLRYEAAIHNDQKL